MRFFFSEPNVTAVISKIQESLSGRKLGKMVNIAQAGEEIQVTISKLGTSTISFDRKTKDGGQEWSLKSEKIALSHRAFKDEVVEKLYKIVEGVGGQVK